jgi:RecA-family ATPase
MVKEKIKNKRIVINAKDLLEKEIPPVEYWVEDIIPKKGLVYCFGSPGSFKTNFLMWMALKGCNGEDVFEFKTKPFRTLWWDEENREVGMRDKLKKLSIGMGIEENIENIQIVVSDDFNVLLPEYIDVLEKEIIKFKPDIVIIDSIAKIFPHDESDSKFVKRIFTQLNPLITRHNVTFILIHHARKHTSFNGVKQMSRDMEDMSGSREFAAMADSVLLVEKLGSGKYMLKQVKNRYADDVYSEDFEVSGDEGEIVVSYGGKSKDKYLLKQFEIEDAIMNWVNVEKLDVFERGQCITAMDKLGYKKSNVDKALKNMRNNRLEHQYGIYSLKK